MPDGAGPRLRVGLTAGAGSVALPTPVKPPATNCPRHAAARAGHVLLAWRIPLGTAVRENRAQSGLHPARHGYPEPSVPPSPTGTAARNDTTPAPAVRQRPADRPASRATALPSAGR